MFEISRNNLKSSNKGKNQKMKNNLRKFLILGCILLSVQTVWGREISVSQFGAVPNDENNDATALRAAAQYCRMHRGTTLVFEPGVYHFRDEEAAKIEREAIDGTLGNGLEVQRKLFLPQKPYVIGMDFSGCKDLTVRATGAVLVVEGWMEVLSFVCTKNVVLDGLTITYLRPGATEACVTAVNGKTVDLSFDPKLYAYIDKVAQGRTYFYSVKKQIFYEGWGEMNFVKPGLIRMSANITPESGDYCIIRYGGHYRPCIMLKESKNVTVKNTSILSFPGMGIVGHLTENILIDGLKVVPEPGRFSSTNTDATHFTSCSGILTIRNSMFRGNGDDCTNIHNYYYSFYPQTENTKRVEIKIENADLHAQSLDYPEKGDTMVVVNRKNLKQEGYYVVNGIDTSTVKWQVIVTLNRPVGTEHPEDYYMTNITRLPKVRILNNTVYCHNGRAFLLKARDVEVRGNVIMKSTLAAIKLGAEVGWHEAGPVNRAIIENNYISDCNTDNNEGPSCIMVGTEAPETPPYLNKNILIKNNVFNTNCETAILLQDAENVMIKDNIINRNDYIKQVNSKNVTIQAPYNQ